MKAHLGDDGLALAFEGAEKELLVMALIETQEDYAVAYERLPESLRKFWAGTLSGDPALAEAAEDLKEARLGWRSERAAALERWLSPGGLLVGSGHFVVEPEEIDLFLTILNDRRLSLAAYHGFDEGGLEADPRILASKELQRAAWEIHFLAYVMENSLAALRAEDGTGDSSSG